MISSPWKSIWRAQVGLRKNRMRHRDAWPEDLQQVEEPGPAPAFAGRLDEAHMSDHDRLAVEVNEPAAQTERGRALGGRYDGSRCNHVQNGLERMLQVEHHAHAEASPGLGAGHQECVEHPAAVLLMVGQAAEEQGRALAAGRDVEGAGGLGAADLGHFGSEQDSPAEHRARVGPGPRLAR